MRNLFSDLLISFQYILFPLFINKFAIFVSKPLLFIIYFLIPLFPLKIQAFLNLFSKNPFYPQFSLSINSELYLNWFLLCSHPSLYLLY